MVTGGRLLMLASLAVAGCRFSDTVTAPYGDPFLVVHGVLITGKTRQSVTVERSREGIQTPVSGARIQLTNLDPPTLCSAPALRVSVDLIEQETRGLYLTDSLCLTEGGRIALRIEVPGGEVVTGTTRLPRIDSLAVTGGVAESTPFGAAGAFILDRSIDTIRIAAAASFARALQVEIVRPELGGNLTLRTIIDTMALSIPASLVDPFEGDGRSVFRAGAYYWLAAAVTDSNYFDFVRSGTNPLTGRGFLNHLNGAVGVFGSVATRKYNLKVIAPRHDPREGTYRITGNLFGADVDISWSIYRDGLALSGNSFSGFIAGTWVDGPVPARASSDLLILNESGASTFRATIFGTVDTPVLPGQVGNGYTLSGVRAVPGQPFPLTVDTFRDGHTETGTVTAVQISGPP